MKPEYAYDLVDISLALPDEALCFPGAEETKIEGPLSFVPGRSREFVYQLSMGTQTGTHIQGAHYFKENGKRIGDYALQRFEGPALIIDCRGRLRLDSMFLDSEIGAIDLSAWKVIFRTGFTKVLLERRNRRGGVLLMEDLEDKPGLTLDGAKWLVEQGVQFLGIDSVGFEPLPALDFLVNRFLCDNDVLLLENLNRLDNLPESGIWLECFPLPFHGLEGTPCRAIIKIPHLVKKVP